MKNVIIILLLIPTFILNAQGDSFEVSKERPELLNQYVVIKKDSMSISDGYNKVIEWININYNTPKEVIKSALKDEYIRIEGYTENMTSLKSLGMVFYYSGKYSITFEFKPNKIKMEITRIQLYAKPSKYSVGGWADQYPNYSMTIRKNGKPKKQMVKYVQGMVNSLNLVLNNFDNYVLNEKKSVVKKDDW